MYGISKRSKTQLCINQQEDVLAVEFSKIRNVPEVSRASAANKPVELSLVAKKPEVRYRIFFLSLSLSLSFLVPVLLITLNPKRYGLKKDVRSIGRPLPSTPTTSSNSTVTKPPSSPRGESTSDRSSESPKHQLPPAAASLAVKSAPTARTPTASPNSAPQSHSMIQPKVRVDSSKSDETEVALRESQAQTAHLNKQLRKLLESLQKRTTALPSKEEVKDVGEFIEQERAYLYTLIEIIDPDAKKHDYHGPYSPTGKVPLNKAQGEKHLKNKVSKGSEFVITVRFYSLSLSSLSLSPSSLSRSPFFFSPSPPPLSPPFFSSLDTFPLFFLVLGF